MGPPGRGMGEIGRCGRISDRRHGLHMPCATTAKEARWFYSEDLSASSPKRPSRTPGNTPRGHERHADRQRDRHAHNTFGKSGQIRSQRSCRGDRLADHRRRGPAKEPDSWQLARLLRPRRERPRRRSAAEQGDEGAPLHSITSSASASSLSGTVRPSALAVLRLMTSMYLVGNWTGRSAGFSPLRMRST